MTAEMPTSTTSETQFPPNGIEWNRVSPKLIVAELIGLAVFWGIGIVVALVLGFVLEQPWMLWVAGGFALILIVSALFTVRRVRAYGYQLRDDDLVYRRGIMFLRIVSVPYGRMQLVDINRGPLSRALGLSELKFVTAAADSGIVIPGLPEAEAEELRDRIVALAETRRAGL